MAASKLTGSPVELMLKYMSYNTLFCCVLCGLVVLSVCFASFPLFLSLIQFYEILAIQCDRCILVGRNSSPRFARCLLAQFELIRHFIPQVVMPASSPAKNCRFSCRLPDHAAGYTELHGTSSRSRAVLTLKAAFGCGQLSSSSYLNT